MPKLPQLEVYVPNVGCSANNYVRHTNTGRSYKTAQSDSFRLQVTLCAQKAAKKARWKQAEYTWVILTLTNIGFDLDNAPKVFLDALQGVAYAHDSRNQTLVVRHLKIKGAEPSYHATVVPIDPQHHRKLLKRDPEVVSHMEFTKRFLAELHPG